MSTNNGIDVIGTTSPQSYDMSEFDTTEEYLSAELGTEVYRAEEVTEDIGQGDTLMMVNEGEEVVAYVAEGPVQAPNVTDEIEQHGVIGTGEASATANQYDSEVADQVAAMYGVNIRSANGNFQTTDETTNVSLESESTDELVERALENHEPIQ
jgi:hypothetical protein